MTAKDPPADTGAAGPGPWPLLRNTACLQWYAGAQLTRLPIAMAPLAFTALTAAVTGSYTTGAAMVSAIMIAEVVCAMPVGRLLDRFGIARPLRVLLVFRGAAYLGLLAASLGDMPPVVLIALAVLVGALGGGLLGGLRALLTAVVGESLLARAVAVNAMLVEGVIVGGPLLVALLTQISATTPILIMAMASAAAALFVPGGQAGARTGRRVGPAGALVKPLFGWAFGVFALGHLLSTIEVAALPLADRYGGGTGLASILVATLCAAAIGGGAVYSLRDRRATVGLAVVLLLVLAGGGLTVTLAPNLPVMLVGAAAAGLCTAPLSAVSSVAAESRVPPTRRAEGFALLNTAQGLGFGVGASTLSVLPLSAVGLLGCASAVLAALVIATTQGREPDAADTPETP
ncbi:MFS transporter [Actinomadura sp. 9N215]|uniref:MFS transporter n=1 Tax=Actinomadura sp. 9N215 TaxID=3375150 RepID=UPI0037A47871